MRKMILGALTVAALSASTAVTPTAAIAQNHRGDYNWQGDRHGWDPSHSYHSDRHYRDRRLGRNDYIYRGGDGRYYCKRNDGTTGLVIGAIGGGLLGNAIGGNTLGTLLGAGGGALLGRSIDRGQVHCR